MTDMTQEVPTPNEVVAQVEPKKDAKPKAFLVYRDNDVYHRAIPAIADQLRVSGINVGMISFPAGTPEEEIRQELEKREEEFGNVVVLTDGTVDRSWVGPRRDELKSRGIAVNPINGNLDSRFDESVFPVIGGETAEEEGWDIEDVKGYSKVFSNVFRAALENERPEKIIVGPSSLRDHQPFSTDHYGFEGEPEDNIAKWIEEAGYPPEDIVVDDVNTLDPGVKVWHIVDRHTIRDNNRISYRLDAAGKLVKGYNPNVRVLRVPLFNLFEDLKEEGIITNETVSPEQLADYVARSIEKDIKAVDAKN
jgi:hypothetical protein